MPAQAGMVVFCYHFSETAVPGAGAASELRAFNPPVSSHLALHKHLQPLQPCPAPRGNHFSPKQSPCKSQKCFTNLCTKWGRHTQGTLFTCGCNRSQKGREKGREATERSQRKSPSWAPAWQLVADGCSCIRLWEAFLNSEARQEAQEQPGGSKQRLPVAVQGRGCSGAGEEAAGRLQGSEGLSQLWRMGLCVREQQITVRPLCHCEAKEKCPEDLLQWHLWTTSLGLGLLTAGGVGKAAGLLSPCGQRPCMLQFKLSCMDLKIFVLSSWPT